MIYLIIGHRGVGKTHWLKNIEKLFSKYKKTVKCFDLDQEIEKVAGKKIDELLLKNERKFRALERKTLHSLVHYHHFKKHPVCISVGAGFSGNFPFFCRIIHLIRETDHSGRVFFNRPRLKKTLSPFEEYLLFYPKRQKFYREKSDESFVLPEYNFRLNPLMDLFFGLKKGKLRATLTVNKNSLPKNKKNWKEFIDKRLNWGLKFFELRDDELLSSELKILMKLIPKEKQLLSFRKLGDSVFFTQDLRSMAWDWPIEKEGSFFHPPIVSLHKRMKSLNDTLKKLETYKESSHLKLAVPIQNLEELLQGHKWFLKDPKRRSFLPFSTESCLSSEHWRWYRQIFGPMMHLHFIRESADGVKDQPFLHEAVHPHLNGSQKFLAVLGDPIAHSASPATHQALCKKHGMKFVTIRMNEKNLTKKNLNILKQLGLVAFAVTSPLKKKVLKLCSQSSREARITQSVNTMILKQGKWYGATTDSFGLKKLLSHVMRENQVAIWGGGGLKKILEKTLPLATFYSARTGKKIKGPINPLPPKFVIWAVGRSRMKNCVLPPFAWKLKKLIDLNYTKDSPGLEYALLSGTEYVSGKKMFAYQAKKQKEIFLKGIRLNES